jgi:hypothetical protein
MATTKTPALAYATGETTEAQEANQKYQEAQQLLLQTLDARKNRLFDPFWLSVAEGFAKPTGSGSFFESIGNVASNINKAQAASEAEDQKIAEMRLNLAQQGLSLSQQRERERLLRSMMPGQAGAPSQGAIPGVGQGASSSAGPSAIPGAGAAGQAALADKPPGMEGVQGTPIMPPNPEVANRRSILMSAISEPGRSMFEIQKELQDLERKRYKEHPEGIVDLATGLLYRISKPIDVAPVSIQLRTIPGLENQTITVPTDVAKQWTQAFNEAIKSGNADKLRSLERSITSTFNESKSVEGGNPAVEAAVRQATGAGGRIATTQDIETSAAAQKEIAMISAKDKATRTSTMMQNAETAANNMPVIEQLRAFAEKPSANRVLGAFTNPNVISQVVRLAETGVSGPGFSIGIPAVRDVVNNMRLTPEEQRDLQLVGQLLVRLQLGMTSAERGSGAVSNYERELFAKSKITQDDLPQTVMAKVNGMARMYKYQVEIADRLQGTGMQYDDYIRTNEGRSLYRQYLSDMQSIVGNLPAGRSPARPARPARPSNQNNPDRQAIDKLLGGK